MSRFFFNTDDLADNGRYRLPWIYSLVPKEDSGLRDREGRKTAKTWRVPRMTLIDAINRGDLPVYGPSRRRYIRGVDLRRWLQGAVDPRLSRRPMNSIADNRRDL
jgi:hypothetical protein